MIGGTKMSRTLRWIPLVLQAAVVAAACSPGASAVPESTPVTQYRGTASPGCSPVDAMSLELRLRSEVSAETVFFNVWPPGQLRPPLTIRFDAAHPIGMATYCAPDGECEQAEWAEVSLASSDGQAVVVGEWALGLSGGRDRRGRFEAEWLAIQVGCG